MECGQNGENGARTYKDKPMQDGNASQHSNMINGKGIKMINQTGNIYNTGLKKGRINQNNTFLKITMSSTNYSNNVSNSFKEDNMANKKINMSFRFALTGFFISMILLFV